MPELPVAPEKLSIEGPVGPLEALLAVPPRFDGARVAVVCHPHPLHGGTMHNKVAHTLARTFEEMGIATLRFNFRGVGASAGSFDDGPGETDDAKAVADHALKRWPHARLLLAGFSFGAFIAARLASRPPMVPRIDQLVGIAPPVSRFRTPDFILPAAPWLIVQGDADDLVAVTDVRDWVAGTSSAPRLVVLEGVGHYFHGRLHELKDVLRRELNQ